MICCLKHDPDARCFLDNVALVVNNKDGGVYSGVVHHRRDIIRVDAG